jgi:hypothetical protein
MSPKYTLVEGTKDDIPALIHVAQEAFRRDAIWRVVIGDVSPEEEHAWLTAFYGKRYSMDDMTLYVAKNEDGYVDFPKPQVTMYERGIDGETERS